MNDSVPEFGRRVRGAAYALRPGGYALIVRRSGQIAVVRTPTGCFLPGGGQERGETPASAAVRETREECGLSIRAREAIGVADELVHAGEGKHFRKHCTFFLAELMSEGLARGEADHELLWLDPREAEACLEHESQRWAVHVALPLLRAAPEAQADPRRRQ